tara:strand:+ start:1259 stop:2146 length:888 start_codon:yes stop_codon:yes gene_type:complete
MKQVKILCLFTIICIFALYIIDKYTVSEGFNGDPQSIPKIIWTFWDGEPSELVKKCIRTWKRHNPDFEVIVLDKENVKTYLPDLEIDKLKHVDGIAHLSDIIRVHILALYGGIWSDASILCTKPYDWILQKQEDTNAEFVGFYIDDFTTEKYKSYSPIIENWFFACVPNSQMMKDWRDKLMYSQQFASNSDYIDDLRATTDFQNIDGPNYLWMHCALQNCLQKNKGKYRFEVIKAEDGPFKYLVDSKWDKATAIDKLFECKKSPKNGDLFDVPFIKFRGCERPFLENRDNDILFQ